MGSLFVASYDFQGYGGGILSHLHKELRRGGGAWLVYYSCSLGADHIESTSPNNSLVVSSGYRSGRVESTILLFLFMVVT
jgi:hypothetical protein